VKRVFKRQVVIFGRSVPVAAIALGLVTIVAAAAWAFNTTLALKATAGSGVVASWKTGSAVCTVVSGPGSISECLVQGGRPIVNVAGVTPVTQIEFQATVINGGTGSFSLKSFTSPSPAMTLVSPEVGVAIGPGTEKVITFDMGFTSSLVEGGVLDYPTFPLIFE